MSFSQQECAHHRLTNLPAVDGPTGSCHPTSIPWNLVIQGSIAVGVHQWVAALILDEPSQQRTPLLLPDSAPEGPGASIACTALLACRSLHAPRDAPLLYGECTDESHPRDYALPALLSSILPPATMKSPKVGLRGSVHGARRRYECPGHHPRAIQLWRMQQHGDHFWVCPRASPFCPKDTGIERRPGAKSMLETPVSSCLWIVMHVMTQGQATNYAEPRFQF